MAIKFENPSPEDIQRTIEGVKTVVGHQRFVLLTLNEDSTISLLTRLPDKLAEKMCEVVSKRENQQVHLELHQQGGN